MNALIFTGMIETGGNNVDNDEPAKQVNGLDIILSLACAGSFVIAIICHLIFKLMQYDAVALITCTIGFISFAVMLITGLILMIPVLKTRTRIIMIISMPNAYAGIMDLTFLNTLRANENKIRMISFIDSGFEKQTWLIIESNG